MRTATVDDIVTEFQRLIEEGWSPDLEDFLRHVPSDLRDPVRQRLAEQRPSGPVKLTPAEAKAMFRKLQSR